MMQLDIGKREAINGAQAVTGIRATNVTGCLLPSLYQDGLPQQI